MCVLTRWRNYTHSCQNVGHSFDSDGGPIFLCDNSHGGVPCAAITEWIRPHYYAAQCPHAQCIGQQPGPQHAARQAAEAICLNEALAATQDMQQAYVNANLYRHIAIPLSFIPQLAPMPLQAPNFRHQMVAATQAAVDQF